MDRDMPESAIQEPTIEIDGDLNRYNEELNHQIERHFRLPNRIDYSSLSKPEQPEPIQPARNGYGVGVGLLFWAACFLIFPKYVAFPTWLAYCFYVVGFIILLVGSLGTCIEVFRGRG